MSCFSTLGRLLGPSGRRSPGANRVGRSKTMTLQTQKSDYDCQLSALEQNKMCCESILIWWWNGRVARAASCCCHSPGMRSVAALQASRRLTPQIEALPEFHILIFAAMHAYRSKLELRQLDTLMAMGDCTGPTQACVPWHVHSPWMDSMRSVVCSHVATCGNAMVLMLAVWTQCLWSYVRA